MVFFAGGGAAAGWSQSLTSNHGPGFRRGLDGWNDDDLGKLYDQKVVSRVGTYVKPYKWRLIASIIGVLGFAITSYLQPLLIGLAIDAIRKRNLGRIDFVGITATVLAMGS